MGRSSSGTTTPRPPLPSGFRSACGAAEAALGPEEEASAEARGLRLRGARAAGAAARLSRRACLAAAAALQEARLRALHVAEAAGGGELQPPPALLVGRPATAARGGALAVQARAVDSGQAARLAWATEGGSLGVAAVPVAVAALEAGPGAEGLGVAGASLARGAGVGAEAAPAHSRTLQLCRLRKAQARAGVAHCSSGAHNPLRTTFLHTP